MVEEKVEEVYDIGYGYGYGNPCRYVHQVFRAFLRCLGFENQDGGGNGGGGDGSGAGNGSGVVDDPPITSSSDDPSIMDPIDEPISSIGNVRRRPPPRGPISSGGPGQTN